MGAISDAMVHVIIRKVARRIPGARKAAQLAGIIPAQSKAVFKPAKTAAKQKSAKTVGAELKRLASLHNPSDADVNLAIKLAESNSIATFALAKAVVLYRAGRIAEAKAAAAEINANDPRLDHALLANLYRDVADLGRHDLAVMAFEYRHVNGPISDSRAAVRIGQARFMGDIYRYHEKYSRQSPNPDPKGYVIVCDHGGPVLSGLMVPIGYELRKRGYQLCSMVAGRMPDPDDPYLAEVSGMMRTDAFSFVDQVSRPDALTNNWTVDWDNGVVSARGINHYSTFLESMTRVARGHKPDLTDATQLKTFEGLLRRSDLMLTLCLRARGIAKATGKPIRLATIDTHFAPWGVVRRWCELEGYKDDIQVIAVSTAYENYFSNLKSPLASTLAIENVTARPTVRHPFLGGEERFNAYLADITMTDAEIEAVKTHININRSMTSEADEAERKAVLYRIKTTKASGGKVFGVFGKVLIDFAAPDDRGHVFETFEDWINFLAREIAGTDNLLIIKPHPHEVRPEIVQSGCRALRTLLPAKLPNNVIYLGHTTFNSYELAERIDCAFVWNGTISVEFPVLKCPVVAESIWAERDYPIGNRVIRTEQEYVSILNGDANLVVSPEARRKAAAFLRFMGSTDVAIPFKYVKRGATNEDIGANQLYTDQIEALEANGDAWVSVAADRFFEADAHQTEERAPEVIRLAG